MVEREGERWRGEEEEEEEKVKHCWIGSEEVSFPKRNDVDWREYMWEEERERGRQQHLYLSVLFKSP